MRVEPYKILVVDDDREIRDLMKHALGLAGYDVLTAADGLEANTALANTRIDAIITDLIMPEKDGMQLIGELRKTHPELRVVAMTGGGHIPTEQYFKVARAFGAHALLSKPFTHSELIETMAKLLPKKEG